MFWTISMNCDSKKTNYPTHRWRHFSLLESGLLWNEWKHFGYPWKGTPLTWIMPGMRIILSHPRLVGQLLYGICLTELWQIRMWLYGYIALTLICWCIIQSFQNYLPTHLHLLSLLDIEVPWSRKMHNQLTKDRKQNAGLYFSGVKKMTHNHKSKVTVWW